MRIIMTPDIAKLHDEVEPYYDENYCLSPNAPEDIKQKEAIIQAYMDEEQAKSEKLNR
jgi:hypothetical protein